MKKLIILLVSVLALNAFANDGLFWSAKTVNGQVMFYRSEKPTPNAATYITYPIKYLKIDKGAVSYMTEIERTAIDKLESDAKIAAEIASSNSAVAQAEAQEAAEASIAADEAKWQGLMDTAVAAEENVLDKDVKAELEALRKAILELRSK